MSRAGYTFFFALFGCLALSSQLQTPQGSCDATHPYLASPCMTDANGALSPASDRCPEPGTVPMGPETPEGCECCSATDPGPGPAPGPASTCADRLETCAKNQKFCLTPKYRHFMHTNCMKTCDFCNDKNADCHDDPFTPCRTFAKNGFCTNAFYSQEFKKQYCPVTCGLC
ncbi:hypothetical protein QR680_013960 [Steinernema hermaphroditum]|uniref:ShKT domain-containing protein n=1 Tax=Steinernema hermaphroditum TaxID=289476 RepID=A0AA39I9J6_9BILA|nr:hypothetical protein QR680_013960 [Steinernema hermaphroditum]